MFTVLLIVIAFVAVVFGVAAILPQDGYGHRPPPRSHYDSYPYNRPRV